MSWKSNKLAEEHWEWVKGLLERTGASQFDIRLANYVYQTAFCHGYKHAEEEFAQPRDTNGRFAKKL